MIKIDVLFKPSNSSIVISKRLEDKDKKKKVSFQEIDLLHSTLVHPQLMDASMISSAYLLFLPVWIRLYNTPVNYYTKETIEEIAKCVGKVLEIVLDLDKSQVQDYVRVRVLFPVANPFRNAKEVQLPTGEMVTISFDNERIRKRCFRCQRLTHDKIDVLLSLHILQLLFPKGWRIKTRRRRSV